MDLRLLEHFLRVADVGSINRAAKELGLSQPALSRSLSQLEHDLGQQLVVRCRTGITITEAGSILASHGRTRCCAKRPRSVKSWQPMPQDVS